MKKKRTLSMKLSRNVVLVTFVALLTIIVVSWPGIRNPLSTLPGNSVSDSGFVSGYYASLETFGITPFSDSQIVGRGVPESIKNPNALNAVAPLSTLVTWLLARGTSPIGSQYFLGFFGWLVTFLVTYSYVRKISSSNLVGFVSGMCLMLSPAMFHWWSGVPTYAHSWIYVGLLCSIFGLIVGQGSTRRSVLIWNTIAVLWSPYVALFALVSTGIGLVVHLARTRRHGIRDFLYVVAPLLAIWCVYGVIGVVNSDQIPERAESDFRSLYLGVSEVITRGNPFYLSIVLLLLVVSLLLAESMKLIRGGQRIRSDENTTRGVLTLVLIACGLFLMFSKLGLTLLGPIVSILPSLVPQFRQGRYSGQVIHVALVLSVVIYFSQQTQRFQLRKRALLVSLIAIVTVDGYGLPKEDLGRWMTKVEYATQPLRELSEKPEGLVAHFPWDLSEELGTTSDPLPCLAQTIHKMPIVNLCDYASSATGLLQSVHTARGCDRLSVLVENLVKYVIVSVAYAQPELMRCLNDSSVPVKFVKIADDAIYEVWELRGP